LIQTLLFETFAKEKKSGCGCGKQKQQEETVEEE
jgi:hypothetical protein